MLRGDFVASQFFDCFLGPARFKGDPHVSDFGYLGCHMTNNKEYNTAWVLINGRKGKGKEKEKTTYMSPRATMHTVCQIPRPIRGVTPRYRPFRPLLS